MLRELHEQVADVASWEAKAQAIEAKQPTTQHGDAP